MEDIENNESRMVGIKPSYNAGPIPVGKIPDSGTQVAKWNQAINETKIIHTVTAGKTLYLSCFIFFGESSVTNVSSYAFVRNVSDVIIYYFVASGKLVVGNDLAPILFAPPLEIAAGFDICVLSSDANCTTMGFVHGYEI